jgi:ribosome maturation factor RimP
METGFEKYIGQKAIIARKSANGGVFVIEGKIIAVSTTHLFVFTANHEEAIALSEVARVQLPPQPAGQRGA